jgi:hypothetical protein
MHVRIDQARQHGAARDIDRAGGRVAARLGDLGDSVADNRDRRALDHRPDAGSIARAFQIRALPPLPLLAGPRYQAASCHGRERLRDRLRSGRDAGRRDQHPNEPRRQLAP